MIEFFKKIIRKNNQNKPDNKITPLINQLPTSDNTHQKTVSRPDTNDKHKELYHKGALSGI